MPRTNPDTGIMWKLYEIALWYPGRPICVVAVPPLRVDLLPFPTVVQIDMIVVQMDLIVSEVTCDENLSRNATVEKQY